MRVYGAYGDGVNFDDAASPRYCRSAVMRGALAMVILTYINVILFVGIVVYVLVRTQAKRQEKKRTDMEMAAMAHRT